MGRLCDLIMEEVLFLNQAKMNSFTMADPANSGFNITQLHSISFSRAMRHVHERTSESSSVLNVASRGIFVEICLFGKTAVSFETSFGELSPIRIKLFGGNIGNADFECGNAATSFSRRS
jgi:hypothetical protein